jgi:hypothetical protein
VIFAYATEMIGASGGFDLARMPQYFPTYFVVQLFRTRKRFRNGNRTTTTLMHPRCFYV